MTNQTRNGLIAVAVVVVGGALAWKFLLRTRRAYVRTILKNNASTGSAITLMSFDEGFLKQWAKAARKNDKTFAYQGKEYNTIGGKSI
jgi:hypothetical protein